jgi:anti-sigma regulatory factor (Ser/Thr protein kinase)
VETVLSPLCEQTAFQVGEPSEIAAVRRAGTQLATNLGFNETSAGRVAIVITEAATNILKHAGHGETLLRPVYSGSMAGVEILALDSGPGMSSIALSMQDGMSSAGSYGVGMGAMQRMANGFDLYSAPGLGCAIWLTLSADPSFNDAAPWQIGAVSLPLPGETACGDAWAAVETANGLTLMVADGLGHGPLAAQASRGATEVIRRNPELAPARAIEEAHAALRSTRGAAVAVASIDRYAGKVDFTGIGNIAGNTESSAGRHHLVSHNGIVGSNMRKVQQFTLPWTDDAMLLMHSDGLATRWNLDQYPGLAARHPALIASVLYRDFARQRDDVTIVVVREHTNESAGD